MTFIDHNIIILMILMPLFAAGFITLIPTADMNSKLTISRFFSVIIFMFCLRLAYLFFYNSSYLIYNFNFTVLQVNINFSIFIFDYTIFLFGALSASLMANMVLYEVNDMKTNIYHVMPFVLTFILFISLGQKDIRVALPAISLANFIIYFLISHSEKSKRGTAIFHTGIFLFTCDALALVLLQYQAQDYTQIALLLPAFARLSLPLCAPFMKEFFLNLDESDGPFILIFLHLAGYLIIILCKKELIIEPQILAAIIGVIATLSAFYIPVAVIAEPQISTIAYYFLTFYSCLSVILFFYFDTKQYWWLYSAFVLVNTILFLHTAKSALLVNQYRALGWYRSRIKATWFLSLCLYIGIPGLGIGSLLWPIFFLIYKQNIESGGEFYILWLIILAIWIIAILLFSYAIKLVLAPHYKDTRNLKASFFEYKSPINKLFIYAPFLLIFVSILIPIATIYAHMRGKIL